MPQLWNSTSFTLLQVGTTKNLDGQPEIVTWLLVGQPFIFPYFKHWLERKHANKNHKINNKGQMKLFFFPKWIIVEISNEQWNVHTCEGLLCSPANLSHFTLSSNKEKLKNNYQHHGLCTVTRVRQYTVYIQLVHIALSTSSS